MTSSARWSSTSHDSWSTRDRLTKKQFSRGQACRVSPTLLYMTLRCRKHGSRKETIPIVQVGQWVQPNPWLFEGRATWHRQVSFCFDPISLFVLLVLWQLRRVDQGEIPPRIWSDCGCPSRKHFLALRAHPFYRASDPKADLGRTERQRAQSFEGFYWRW